MCEDTISEQGSIDPWNIAWYRKMLRWPIIQYIRACSYSISATTQYRVICLNLLGWMPACGSSVATTLGLTGSAGFDPVLSDSPVAAGSSDFVVLSFFPTPLPSPDCWVFRPFQTPPAASTLALSSSSFCLWRRPSCSLRRLSFFSLILLLRLSFAPPPPTLRWSLVFGYINNISRLTLARR